MLHVILIILKIIGIIIAVILGLLLLIILSVLLIPIRYRVSGKKYDQMNGTIKITWLFHILSTCAAYENNEFKFYVKIFGFSLFKEKDKVPSTNRKRKKHQESYKEDENEYEEITVDVDSKEEILKSNDNSIIRELTSESIVSEDIVKIQSIGNDENLIHSKKTIVNKKNINTVKKLKYKKHKKRQQYKKMIGKLFQKITTKFHILFIKIKLIIDKIRNTIIGIGNRTIIFYDFITDKIKFFKENINTQENKDLVKFLFAQLKVLLKHLKPSRYKIYVKFGTNEPDVTGKILAYTSVANSFINLNLDLVPVFDETVFEGEIYLKGRIRMITLVLIAFRVYRNKQFKKIMKKFI